MKRSDVDVEKLIQTLEKDGIKTVLRQNDKGQIYGITYVDFRTKCVFNGSDLGKQYSAKAISERCGYQQQQSEKHENIQRQTTSAGTNSSRNNPQKNGPLTSVFLESSDKNSGSDDSLDILFQPTFSPDSTPWQLRKSRRRKQQKQSHSL